MNFLQRLSYLKDALKSSQYIFNILSSSAFSNARYLGEIVRNTHSIEKGLSLENIRPTFGYEKIKNTHSIILKYKNNGGNMQAQPLVMFIDALKAYLDYHKQIEVTNERIKSIENFYHELSNYIKTINGTYGGVLEIERTNYTSVEQELLAKIINNRHSTREFDHTPINQEDLQAAIKIALRCPSACNRQGFRVYILDKQKFNILNGWFDGIGGFVNDLDKLVFITGKMSVYWPSETHQWIVAGSIFASYLTISLEAYNIGCCFIQRPVLPNLNWEKTYSKIGAEKDELLVCCLGLGNFKKNYTVPISFRFDDDTLVSFI